MSKKTFIIGGDPTTYPPNKGTVRECLLGLDQTKRWKITVEPYVKRRSKSQDGLYRIWCGEIAQETGHDNDEIAEILKRKFCPVKTVTIAGEELEKQSTKYLSTQEMSDYMTRIQGWAASMLNMTLSLPEDLGAKGET